jgi:CrcB protein
MGRDPREEGTQAVTALTPAALILVAIGGAIGSATRFALSVVALHALGPAFPWGTLAVNILGSAAIGAAAGSGMEGQLRLLVVTGFLGGFTTFSAFSLETATLFERSPALAALYVAASVGLGLGAFWLAWTLAKG